MGHTAIPILMAVLSCCVWENVEVRTTHGVSHVKRWRIVIKTKNKKRLICVECKMLIIFF